MDMDSSRNCLQIYWRRGSNQNPETLSKRYGLKFYIVLRGWFPDKLQFYFILTLNRQKHDAQHSCVFVNEVG